MTAIPPELAARLAAQRTPLRQVSLCLLLREGEILLARKKRGFGVGKWNGAGGKPEPGEPIERTAIRETEEEFGVTPRDLRRVATLDFFFPQTPEYAGWDQQVCVFVGEAWDGEPTESEEMAPRWFPLDALPLAAMWPDDVHWLPLVLAGKRLRAHFLYASADVIAEWAIEEGVV